MLVILYKTGFITLSRFCRSQQVPKEFAYSAATHSSAPRRVWPVRAKLSVLRIKLAVSICQNFLWPVCASFAAKCPPQLRKVM